MTASFTSWRWLGTAALSFATLFAAAQQPAPPPPPADDALVLDAREALRKKDRVRLAAAKAVTAAQKHPLAPWVDYWELSQRLAEVNQDELDAFYARWPGTYVEDRLRNDWLLELGRRRDWAHFAREVPRFKMNDDREVTCYALFVDHVEGKPVRDAALAAWMAQRDLDDGCNLLAATLYAAKVFTDDDAWRRVRQAAEGGRPRAARAAAGLVDPAYAAAVGDAFDQPVRYLARKASARSRAEAELAAAAIARMAANDPDIAADQMKSRWQRELPPDLAAWAWAQTARQSALKLSPDAAAQYRTALALYDKAGGRGADWSDDTLAWAARAALRAGGADRWRTVVKAIDAMSPAEQRDTAWQYWRARALRETAREGLDGDAQRQQAALLLQGLAGQLNFYGKLAAEDLGQTVAMPPRPVPLTKAERDVARDDPGFARALRLIGLGLRNEGVREWNYGLRGLDDRQLLAAAQWACDREVWDRCINTSDRTRGEIDIEQRYPTPFRQQVVDKTREIGLDAAYVYGLIRQESRFVMDARSSVGASGLMQLMPATARWTAKKIGLPYTNEMITDRDVNLKLGTNYLKLVLEDFGGSQAMAAAAYNAGPNRLKRWRDGPPLETAAWAENIPFTETRDYVKKVLSNTAVYASLLGGSDASFKARLGGPIGPPPANAPVPVPDLP